MVGPGGVGDTVGGWRGVGGQERLRATRLLRWGPAALLCEQFLPEVRLVGRR